MTKHTGKHTRGPWEVGQDGVMVYGPHVGPVMPVICEVEGKIKESKENAKLIAAAPDLLAVCKDELYALKGWRRAIKEYDQEVVEERREYGSLEDVIEGIAISISKIKYAVDKATGGRS